MQLRPYQEKAVNFLLDTSGRGIIRAPTGAGKTVIALSAATRLRAECILIMVPRYSALITWQENLVKTNFCAPDDICVIEKWPKNKRQTVWEDPRQYKVTLVLYATAQRDKELIAKKPRQKGYDHIICDESHKFKNHKTKTYKAVKHICLHRMSTLLTATPQSKGPQDIWTSLNILSPKVFTSYWSYVNKYCEIDDTGFGRKITGVNTQRLPELRSRIRTFLFNINESDTDGWVPKRVRKVLHVEMDRKTQKVYDQLARDLIATLPSGDIVMVPSLLAKTTKLRQLLICPEIVHPSLSAGAGFEAVVDHAESNDRHVVLFSEFTQPFDVWARELHKKKYKVFILKGGMSREEASTTIAKFSACKNSETPSFLLCSIAFAESFDLLTPTTAYFLGYSWDQIMNYQAEGRLTRGQKTHCNFFYVMHDGTIDTAMLEVLDGKVETTKQVIKDFKNRLLPGEVEYA